MSEAAFALKSGGGGRISHQPRAHPSNRFGALDAILASTKSAIQRLNT
jgi:hypothetical protein